ncbi:uncharacterized protein LOC142354361 [Convolutriloba macropyga]|uniref:uncharacterized protein LOC142354361 n=1 Tax=Convolutriloba macropyga TaxID=536237 RepID=UPI003F52394C
MSRSPYGAENYSEHHEDETEYVTERKCICRPFRLIGFICLCVALVLLFVALLSDWWAHSKNEVYSQGLWTSCRKSLQEVYERQDDGSRVFTEKKVETCSDIDPKDTWLKSVIALVIIAIILTCLSIVAILVSLCWNSQAAANVAGCFALAALAVLIVSLVVFLFMFSEEFEDIDVRLDPEREDYYSQKKKWYFGWGHGCGWAAAILLCGAACLFLLCKVQDEIYEAEKTYKVEKNRTQPADRERHATNAM